jgi:hypothetical protein
MEEAPICVHGEPCFHGYKGVLVNESNATKPAASLMEGEWVHTVNLGHLYAEEFQGSHQSRGQNHCPHGI